MMGNFYRRLSYSLGNEDPNSEHRALRIQPKDRILCVTASGDRPLNLMTREFNELVTIDANPLQNALFDLKRVALSKLSFDDYMAFIGVTPSRVRVKTFKKLAKHLDPISSNLWELMPRKIEKGILYEGSIEKLCVLASSVIKFFRGKKIETLFSMDNLQQQREFVATQWQTPLWKKTVQLALHPFLTRTFMKDPGLYEHVDPNIHVGSQVFERLDHYLQNNLAKESVLLSLFLKGKVDPIYFPPYLTENGVAKIKKQVKKTKFYTDDIVSYIHKAPSDSFDCFSMSDVPSYLDKTTFNRLLEGLIRCAKPEARFCMRQFLSNHQIPSHLTPFFKRDTTLERELRKEDRCFVYTFMTGTINKSHLLPPC